MARVVSIKGKNDLAAPFDLVARLGDTVSVQEQSAGERQIIKELIAWEEANSEAKFDTDDMILYIYGKGCEYRIYGSVDAADKPWYQAMRKTWLPTFTLAGVLCETPGEAVASLKKALE